MPPAGRSRRPADVVAGVAVFLLPFAILGHALRPGVVMSPADNLLIHAPWSASAPGVRAQNPLLTDTAFMTHPALIHARTEIHAGRFPLWNAHAFAGAPFFANPQTALLFPLTALAWMLPLATAITLISILKLSIAGVSSYWTLRVLQLSPLAASLGAVTFLASGMLVVWLQWATATALALLPLVFGATERLRQRPDLRRVAVLAAAIGVSVLGGYPQITAQAVGLAGAWLLVRVRATPRWPRAAVAWVGSAALGVALSAVQVLPFLEYLRESSVYFYRAQWSPIVQLPLRSAVAMLMPYYFGSHTTRDFWGYWNFVEMTTTVGLVPWVLLPVALVVMRRRADAAFFLVVAAITWSSVYGLVPARLVAALPGTTLFITNRLAASLTFALAAVAAIGLDAIATATRAERRVAAWVSVAWFATLVGVALALLLADAETLARMPMAVSGGIQYAAFVALSTVATVIALRSLRAGVVARLGALVLIAVQTVTAIPMLLDFNPVIDRRLFYPAAPPAIAHVRSALGRSPGRVVLSTPPGVGVVYGLDEVGGYDGLTPRRVEQLASPGAGGGLMASGPLPVRLPVDAPAFDLFGVRYVVTPRNERVRAAHLVVEYDGPDARVYRNPRALPRTFLVFRARCVDDATALRLLHSGDFDPRDEVLLAACDAVRPPMPGVRRSATVDTAGASLVVETDTDAPAYLVIADTWFPGWTARIDGVDHAVLRANHAFRAIHVPAGRHRVELDYRPASLLWGSGISAAALFVIAALFVVGGRRA